MRFPKPLSLDGTARPTCSAARCVLCAALAAAVMAPAHAAADLTSLSPKPLHEVTVVGTSKHEQQQSAVAVAHTPTGLPGIVVDHAAPAAPVAAGLEDHS